MNSARIAALLLAATLVTAPLRAEPNPRPFYKSWKWWLGEGALIGVTVADAQITSRCLVTCGSESSILLPAHPRHGQVWLAAGGIVAFHTTIHALSYHYLAHDPSRTWRAIGFTAWPATGVLEEGLIGIGSNLRAQADCRRAQLECR